MYIKNKYRTRNNNLHKIKATIRKIITMRKEKLMLFRKMAYITHMFNNKFNIRKDAYLFNYFT